MISINTKAPDFVLKDQDGNEHSLSMYKGKKVLLYFYPKDDTPGCTVEACSFRDSYEDLKKVGLVVLGVSKDSVRSHAKFAQKYDLPFPLLSDESTNVIQAYGAWRKKKFMGREYMGTERISVMINEEGNVEKIYDTVVPKDHVEEVKNSLV